MVILHIHWRFDGFGGGENLLKDMCRAQAGSGHAVSVLTAKGYAGDPLEGVQVLEVAPSSGVRSGYSAVGSFRRLVEKVAPDVIHFHETRRFVSPVIVSALNAVWPTVKTIHDGSFFCLHQSVGRVKLFRGTVCRRPMNGKCVTGGCYAMRLGNLRETALGFWEIRVARCLDRLIVSSRYMREELVRNRFDGDRISLAPLWTELADEPPIPVSEEGRDRRLLYVGRLDRGKGVAHFVAALDLLRERAWQADVVGSGPSWDAIRQLVDRLDLRSRIVFHGALPRERLADMYRSAHMVCVPSIVPESFGLVGIEAMAHARPVVAFDSGGVSDWLVNGETGLLVEHGNTIELADAMARLLDDTALARHLGLQGRARVDRLYRRSAGLSRLYEAYDRVIPGRSGVADESRNRR